MRLKLLNLYFFYKRFLKITMLHFCHLSDLSDLESVFWGSNKRKSEKDESFLKRSLSNPNVKLVILFQIKKNHIMC